MAIGDLRLTEQRCAAPRRTAVPLLNKDNESSQQLRIRYHRDSTLRAEAQPKNVIAGLIHPICQSVPQAPAMSREQTTGNTVMED